MEPSQEVLQEAWKWILAQSPCGTSNLLAALRMVMEELLKNGELLEISCSACMILCNIIRFCTSWRGRNCVYLVMSSMPDQEAVSTCLLLS